MYIQIQKSKTIKRPIDQLSTNLIYLKIMKILNYLKGFLIKEIKI